MIEKSKIVTAPKCNMIDLDIGKNYENLIELCDLHVYNTAILVD